MPNTVQESIALEIIDRLERIRTVNGFAFDVASVNRPNRDGSEWTPAANTIVVVMGDEERDPDSDCPGNPPAIAYTTTFTIQGFVRQSDNATTADQTKVSDMTASIKKSIAGTNNWHNMGGFTWDCDWGTATPFSPDNGAHAGVSVELVSKYRVSEYDPYTVRA